MERLVADELITGITRDNVFSLVSQCVEGMGYTASRIFPNDVNGTSKIALFSKRALEDFNQGTLAPQLGTVITTPRPRDKGERVTIYCMTDWQATGFDPGFSPCEVGAAIMRYLLRMVEGVERAEAWRAPWEKDAHIGDLSTPLTVTCRTSTLKELIDKYAIDNNLSVGLWQSVTGTIQITQEWAGGVQGALIGFDGEKLEGGQIRLTPYLNDTARALPAAVKDLRRLRAEIEAAASPPLLTEVTPALSYVEQRIKEIYDLIISNGELYPTDEAIAANLPLGRKGQPYTRETVNRYRVRMRGRGIVV